MDEYITSELFEDGVGFCSMARAAVLHRYRNTSSGAASMIQFFEWPCFGVRITQGIAYSCIESFAACLGRGALEVLMYAFSLLSISMTRRLLVNRHSSAEGDVEVDGIYGCPLSSHRHVLECDAPCP